MWTFERIQRLRQYLNYLYITPETPPQNRVFGGVWKVVSLLQFWSNHHNSKNWFVLHHISDLPKKILTCQNILRHQNILPKIIKSGFWSKFHQKIALHSKYDILMKNCRVTILNLGKDSPESGKHSRYPESMSGLPIKIFLINSQKSYFFEKAFFEVKNSPTTSSVTHLRI